jgi:hypothetical protein
MENLDLKKQIYLQKINYYDTLLREMDYLNSENIDYVKAQRGKFKYMIKYHNLYGSGDDKKEYYYDVYIYKINGGKKKVTIKHKGATPPTFDNILNDLKTKNDISPAEVEIIKNKNIKFDEFDKIIKNIKLNYIYSIPDKTPVKELDVMIKNIQLDKHFTMTKKEIDSIVNNLSKSIDTTNIAENERIMIKDELIKMIKDELIEMIKKKKKELKTSNKTIYNIRETTIDKIKKKIISIISIKLIGISYNILDKNNNEKKIFLADNMYLTILDKVFDEFSDIYKKQGDMYKNLDNLSREKLKKIENYIDDYENIGKNSIYNKLFNSTFDIIKKKSKKILEIYEKLNDYKIMDKLNTYFYKAIAMYNDNKYNQKLQSININQDPLNNNVSDILQSCNRDHNNDCVICIFI